MKTAKIKIMTKNSMMLTPRLWQSGYLYLPLNIIVNAILLREHTIETKKAIFAQPLIKLIRSKTSHINCASYLCTLPSLQVES